MQVAGFVVREASRRTSSWRADGSLADELLAANVVGIEGIDTRRLTLRLREHGAMRAAISTADVDAASLVERVQASPTHGGRRPGQDRVGRRSRTRPQPWSGPAEATHGVVFRVAAYDYGIKRNILRRLAAMGCEATVFPAETPPAEIAAGGFDGVFLSNGPGDPAVTAYGIAAVRGLIGKVPIFGICLGHQLLALALGGRTFKMRFGHRGVNQPVKNLAHRRRGDHQPQPRVRGGPARLDAHGGCDPAGGYRPRARRADALEPERRHAGRVSAASMSPRSRCSTTPRRPPDRTTRATCSRTSAT